jgi:MFS family permease
MKEQRWLRIIPVALLMYTISYVDRTNISLALDPNIASMMKDLAMDDRMKGHAAGIFFFGYLLMQMPGGYCASRWSARKFISLCLVCWGVCAAGCGLCRTYGQFECLRFLLGVAESGVFPATLVLLANWFPRAERARANAYWSLCQPLALVASAPITSTLLGAYGWKTTLLLEGLLPFIWLPIWWFGVRDHPREAKWISAEERNFIETTLQQEAAQLEPPRAVAAGTTLNQPGKAPLLLRGLLVLVVDLLAMLRQPALLVMVLIYFLHNCAAYGCMVFFTGTLKDRGFSPLEYGILFAVPYAVTAVVMVLNSRHSDKTLERRGHVAVVYALSGASLILSVCYQQDFWLSYALMCLAIPGPFAAIAPFYAIPSETLPRAAMALTIGLVNAFGNLGGFAGPYLVGWLKNESHSLALPFNLLGAGMLLNAALAFLLPSSASIEARQGASKHPAPS